MNRFREFGRLLRPKKPQVTIPDFPIESKPITETHFIPGQYQPLFSSRETKEFKKELQPNYLQRIKSKEPKMYDTREHKSQGKKIKRIVTLLDEIINDLYNQLGKQKWNINRTQLSFNEKKLYVYWKLVDELEYNEELKERNSITQILEQYEPVIQKILTDQLKGYNGGYLPTKYSPKIHFRWDAEHDNIKKLDAIFEKIK
ncbi:hypothetical protein HDV04_001731 [Boothiomyces sp. JEL0838]|nr:hypothetical protein HDV04_001731 [Boothiomyces sp. JEL0838]